MNLLSSARSLVAIIESVIVFFVVLFGTGQTVKIGDYLAGLDDSGVYENAARDSLPQTAVYGIIAEHFAKERGDGKIPKCLIVGYDGARADALVYLVGGESGILEVKNDGGGIYNMFTGGTCFNTQATDTAPGWMSMLTGLWADEHGVPFNGVIKPMDAPKTIFINLLENELIQKSAYIVSWSGHFTSANATYRNEIAYGSANSLNAEWITMDNDAGTFNRTKNEILNINGADIIMCILEHCDSAGHGSGFGNQNPEYIKAFRNSDHNAYELIQALKSRPSYDGEDWLIVLASDHGGAGYGHGTQFSVARQVFLAVNKPIQ